MLAGVKYFAASKQEEAYFGLISNHLIEIDSD